MHIHYIIHMIIFLQLFYDCNNADTADTLNNQ